MTDDLLIWCRDDSPHGEHWRQNAFNGRNYCSGRPAPKPEPADLLDEATRLADPTNGDVCMGPHETGIMVALIERVQQAEAARQEWADLWQQASMSVLTLQDEAKTLTRELHEARGKLDKVRALADEAPDNLLDELRTLLAILDDKTGD